MTAKNVATANATSLTAPPDWLQGSNLGNENVSSDDMTRPRLKLTQQMSPELVEGGPNYIEGVKQGQILNTVTKKAVDTLDVVNLYYTREYALYGNRQKGMTGYFGRAGTETEALAIRDSLEGDADNYSIVETGQHLVIILDENHNPESEAVVSMDGTKMQTSNTWNSNIALTHADRFASIWTLSTIRQSNSKGSWFNYKTDFKGWVDKDLHDHAKSLYEQISKQTVQ
jgi:hypothetical protein